MSFVNRVWDAQNGPGFVRWRTQAPDPDGLLYPGPGVFGVDTSDYVLAASKSEQAHQPAQVLDTTYAPTALYTFDGDILDSSGNGRDLSVATGAALYGPGPVPGIKALYCNGALRLARTDAAFAALADVTIQATLCPAIYHTAVASVAHYSGPGETSIDNFHYYLRIAADNQVSSLWEFGAGSNYLHAPPYYAPHGKWFHWCNVRRGTTSYIFVNGLLVSRDTGATLPTDGSNNDFHIGAAADNTAFYTGLITNVKVNVGLALTADQVLAEARLALPPELRP